jgi:hypothetical protein
MSRAVARHSAGARRRRRRKTIACATEQRNLNQTSECHAADYQSAAGLQPAPQRGERIFPKYKCALGLRAVALWQSGIWDYGG